MKIKFNSDDKLLLNKTIEIPINSLIPSKYYSQVFLDECLHKLWPLVFTVI